MTIFLDDEGVTSGMAIVTLRLERIDTAVPCLAKHARHGAPALRIFSSANRTDAGSGEAGGDVFDDASAGAWAEDVEASERQKL